MNQRFSRINVVLIFLAVSLQAFTVSCQKDSQPNNNVPQTKAEGLTNPPKTKAEGVAEGDRKSRETRLAIISKERVDIESRIQESSELKDLVSKHNAVPYWAKDLENSSQAFAINVQELLVRNDKRPILVIARINDVAKDGYKFILYLESVQYETDIYFTLECNIEQARKITNQDSSPNDEYALIVNVSTVRKLKLSISASPQGEGEDVWAQVDLDTSRAFAARGRCLELLNLGLNVRE